MGGDNVSLTPEEAKAQEMYRVVCGQRDAVSNAYTDALGDLAAWRARWNDPALLQARLDELQAGKTA